MGELTLNVDQVTKKQEKSQKNGQKTGNFPKTGMPVLKRATSLHWQGWSAVIQCRGAVQEYNSVVQCRAEVQGYSAWVQCRDTIQRYSEAITSLEERASLRAWLSLPFNPGNSRTFPTPCVTVIHPYSDRVIQIQGTSYSLRHIDTVIQWYRYTYPGHFLLPAHTILKPFSDWYSKTVTEVHDTS